MEEVRLREVPERVVLVGRRKVLIAELPGFVSATLEAHRTLLTEAGVDPAGPPYVSFAGPVTDEVAGTVDVCTPVPDPIARRTDLLLRVEPLHREAFTTITKRQFAYPAVLDAYALVETWAYGQGLTPVGPLREVLWGDLDRSGEDDLVVDIVQPVR